MSLTKSSPKHLEKSADKSPASDVQNALATEDSAAVPKSTKKETHKKAKIPKPKQDEFEYFMQELNEQKDFLNNQQTLVKDIRNVLDEIKLKLNDYVKDGHLDIPKACVQVCKEAGKLFKYQKNDGDGLRVLKESLDSVVNLVKNPSPENTKNLKVIAEEVSERGNRWTNFSGVLMMLAGAAALTIGLFANKKSAEYKTSSIDAASSLFSAGSSLLFNRNHYSKALSNLADVAKSAKSETVNPAPERVEALPKASR